MAYADERPAVRELCWSYANLTELPEATSDLEETVESLYADHNLLVSLPPWLALCQNLRVLEISHNLLEKLPDELSRCRNLHSLVVKNNRLLSEGIPKDFDLLVNLEILNLNGNRLDSIPPQITRLPKLEFLSLGANAISSIPRQIQCLSDSLTLLYLGGNLLREIPAEVGTLRRLTCLSLCDNKLTYLPSSLGRLRDLQSLSLHGNRLSTLPHDIVHLERLSTLSLRNNPLVLKFCKNFTCWSVPSLAELAGRVVRANQLHYCRRCLPSSLCTYLDSARECLNPNCKGVYFASRLETVKFVDFCGKFRVPFLQFICSPDCQFSSDEDTSGSELVSDDDQARMRRVLLG